MDVVAYLLMAGGLFFFWVSGLGLIRMPDLFTRMHAGTKATTLGSLLMLLGVAALEPAWAPKLLILALFTLLTNPLSSSVLARAAHRTGTDTVAMAHDAYAERVADQPAASAPSVEAVASGATGGVTGGAPDGAAGEARA